MADWCDGERKRERFLFNDAQNCEVYTASITYEYKSLVRGRWYSENPVGLLYLPQIPHGLPGIETPPPRLETATKPCHSIFCEHGNESSGWVEDGLSISRRFISEHKM